MNPLSRRWSVTGASVAVLACSVAVLYGRAGHADPPPPLPPGEAPELRWLEEGDRAILQVQTDQARPVSARIKASLGGLSHTWEEDLGWTDTSGWLEVDLRPPAAAAVHEVAADYVSDFRVHVEIGGTVQLAPQAYLAWPDGVDAKPVIWTPTQADRLAPNGVLDAALRATARDPGVRLMPALLPGRSRSRAALQDSGRGAP